MLFLYNEFKLALQFYNIQIVNFKIWLPLLLPFKLYHLSQTFYKKSFMLLILHPKLILHLKKLLNKYSIFVLKNFKFNLTFYKN